MNKFKLSSSSSICLGLLLLFLAFSMVFSRTLNSMNTDMEWVQESEVKQGKFWGLSKGNELKLEGRMELETDDYTGAGANKNHDPKPPGSD